MQDLTVGNIEEEALCDVLVLVVQKLQRDLG